MRHSFILVIALVAFSWPCEARHRLETYVDHDGVRRVVKTHKIYRDYIAVREFKRTHPMPNDGHAYDIDHIVPLSKGGADRPSNMQWIRVEDHRRKSAHEKQK